MQSNYKRIAKNTGFLYVRMILNVFVALYTSRVILNALGVVDFGIYNVVGGIIGMITFFQSTLTNVNLRFFSFDLGRDDKTRLKYIYQLSNFVYLFLVVFVLLLAETLGLWFVNTKLTIPIERIVAANWLYQCSILSFIFSLMSITNNAAVIAHENMDVFAYIGLFQTFANLAIAMLINDLSLDRLIVYGILQTFIFGLVFLSYVLYSKKHYDEFSLRLRWNKSLFKEMMPYISWNLFGCAAWALNGEGLNILMNIFFGPVINAGRGIAFQISNVTKMFSNSIYSAFRPQITKMYASGNFEEYRNMLFNSTRYSFFLSWCAALPILFNIDLILKFWLGNVPNYTAYFAILTILFSLVDVFNEPIWTAVQATGKIKNYQLYGNLIFMLAFPISWLCLWLGGAPYIPMYTLFFIRIIYIVFVLNIVKFDIMVDIREFTKRVFFPILIVVSLSVIVLLFFSYFLSFSSKLLELFVSGFLSVSVGFIFIWYIGLCRKERKLVVKLIKNRIIR